MVLNVNSLSQTIFRRSQIACGIVRVAQNGARYLSGVPVSGIHININIQGVQAVTKRAGRKKDASNAKGSGGGGAQTQVRKAVFESTKKKEVGVSDLTLISKISNEAINDNLKKRFENAEIYVREGDSPHGERACY